MLGYWREREREREDSQRERERELMYREWMRRREIEINR